jgi:hypothetical protein
MRKHCVGEPGPQRGRTGLSIDPPRESGNPGTWRQWRYMTLDWSDISSFMYWTAANDLSHSPPLYAHTPDVSRIA